MRQSKNVTILIVIKVLKTIVLVTSIDWASSIVQASSVAQALSTLPLPFASLESEFHLERCPVGHCWGHTSASD
jgi:hypothetical protein